MITVSRRPVRTVAAGLAAVLTVMLIALVAWNFLMAPRMRIRRVVLDSDLNITDSQLMEMLALEGRSWASLDEGQLAERLESYPVVRKARVVKVFPDTVKLYVYRRRPLIVALVDSPTATVPVVFDEEGYAVQVGVIGDGTDLPVISGPRFTEPAVGARLPESMHGILDDLTALRSDDPRAFDLVSEIEMIPRGEAGMDLKLYMNHVDIPVLIDRNISSDSIRRAVLVLDVLASEGVGNVDEADMRGGHVVFRRVEES